MSFLFAAPNIVFTVSLGVLALLLALEFAGSGLSDVVEGMFPDLDADVPDADDVSMPSQFLSWLRSGRVPMLMVFAVFLGVFGAGGLLLQHLVATLFGAPLHVGIASLTMLPLSLPLVKMAAAILARMMPRDETAVISREDLIGRIAVIVTGHARKGFPAQAKLRDEFRTTHYVMVEPDEDGIELRQGEEIALMARRGAVYVAKRVAPAQLTHQP
ncbi:MAG: YqiJ family protein [Xanthomonadales bacterium]|nr:YqiJ family protein [Xanthomonadales bacterium]MCC6560301.1 YqiJ family protein [Xanthomonadales bacterium]